MRRRGPLHEADIRRFYDRFGAWQDWQWYEQRALDTLVSAGEFGSATAVFELGCGTGRFAERLLRDDLPTRATYTAIDVSPTMVRLARSRLERWGDRATIEVRNGVPSFGEPDGAFDRVIAAYVLDLLSESAIRRVLDEARRVLRPDGRLCIVTLTQGTTPISWLVSSVWRAVYRIDPRLVGGCRPLRRVAYHLAAEWRVRTDIAVTSFGIASNIVTAEWHRDRAR